MFRALRAVRSSLPARPVALNASSHTLRALSTTPRRLSDDHHGPPQVYGPGAKNPKGIPTDDEQATGIERFQLLGRMEGVDVFDMKPLDASRVGTPTDPIMVQSFFPERIVGCTGCPADSHDTIWLNLNTTLKNHRCPECGSVYNLDFQGSHDEHHH